MTDLKKVVGELMNKGTSSYNLSDEQQHIVKKFTQNETIDFNQIKKQQDYAYNQDEDFNIQDTEEIIEASLSITDLEKELIVKALEKYNGKRKQAAQELGISERTLYRKIRAYNISQ